MTEAQIIELVANGGGGLGTAVLLGLWLRSVIVSRFNALETRLKSTEDRIGRLEGSLLTPPPVVLPPKRAAEG